MINKDFNASIKAKFTFMGSEDITSKGKTFYIYYFQMETAEGVKFVKVISDISPEFANNIVLSSFNNQITLRIV
jgi:hypothetical protein